MALFIKVTELFWSKKRKIGNWPREKNILGGIVGVVGILDMDHWELETSFYV